MDGARERASEARLRMVAEQLRKRDIRDERVLAAMGEVERDAFVPKDERGDAYTDGPLPIGGGQTISQPYIVARMTELLAVGPGDRVLDIGTGSGYQAAVLAAMGCLVTSMERDPDLALAAMDRLADAGYGDRVLVSVGDGSLGAPGGRAVGRHRRRGRGPVDPRSAARAARRPPSPRHPRRRPARAAAAGRRATRQRVARDIGRAVRLRAAGGRRRLAAVGRDGALTASRSPGPVGILGRP